MKKKIYAKGGNKYFKDSYSFRDYKLTRIPDYVMEVEYGLNAEVYKLELLGDNYKYFGVLQIAYLRGNLNPYTISDIDFDTFGL